MLSETKMTNCLKFKIRNRHDNVAVLLHTTSPRTFQQDDVKISNPVDLILSSRWKVLWILRGSKSSSFNKVIYTVHCIYPRFLSKTKRSKAKLVILHRHRSCCLRFLVTPSKRRINLQNANLFFYSMKHATMATWILLSYF